jgi:hypothetical protein
VYWHDVAPKVTMGLRLWHPYWFTLPPLKKR